MTVKTISPEDKKVIGDMYESKTHNQKELATLFHTSERTINRVLNELNLLTAVPRLKGEARKALDTLSAWGINPEQLQKFLEELEDGGLLVTEDGRITATAKPQPTREQIVAVCMNMEESTWGKLLSDIVTARVAKAANTHTQTAMLNIQQQVDSLKKNQG